MPIDRAVLERNLQRVNGRRKADERVQVEAFSPQRFALSFPDRAMPEGQCIDQDFSEIQFDLLENDGVYTGIQSGRLDEATGRYVIEYEVTEWDD
jgi:hypothetical protein